MLGTQQNAKYFSHQHGHFEQRLLTVMKDF